MTDHRTIWFIWLLCFIWLLIGVLIGPLITEADAHEATNVQGQPLGWTYPISCCSLRDCRPTNDGEIRETPEGYELISTGEIIPYQDKRVRESPDGTFHTCQQGGDFDKGRVLCLFAPGRAY